MFICPECNVPLKKKINSFGLFWVCPVCNGRAVTLEIIRKSMPRPVVNELWQRARSGEFKAKRSCPVCRRKMSEIPIVNEVKMLYLDVCAGCHFVWFDPNEFESLPIYENIADLATSIRKLKALGNINILLSSWEDPIVGSGRIKSRIDQSLQYLNKIHDIICSVTNVNSIEPIELCGQVVNQLGLPPAAINPLVAKGFVSSLAIGRNCL